MLEDSLEALNASIRRQSILPWCPAQAGLSADSAVLLPSVTEKGAVKNG